MQVLDSGMSAQGMCVVCRQAADVWCHQDEACLCRMCDHEVHMSGPLAWKHKRTALPGRELLADRYCRISHHSATGVDSSAHVCEENSSGNPTAAEAEPCASMQSLVVPDVFTNGCPSGLLDDCEPFQFNGGFSDDLDVFADSLISQCKPAERLRNDWHSMACLDSSPRSHSVVPHEAAQTPKADCQGTRPDTHPPAIAPTDAESLTRCSAPAPAQPLQQRPAMCGAEGPLTQGPPVQLPQHTMNEPQLAPPESGSFTFQPAFDAVGMRASAPSQPCGPFFMPSAAYGAHLRNCVGAFMMPQSAAWMSYVPASLQPKACLAETQRQRQRQACTSRLNRFREKKRALSRNKKVRYVNRKRYADSRPRVNGRFIRKSDNITPAVTACVQ